MTIEDADAIRSYELQRHVSSRSLPRSLIRFALLFFALFLVAAAVSFPVQQIEDRRAANLASRRDELTQQASALQPGDDTYIKIANTPYPINTTKLFPLLLSVDAVLLIILAALLSRLRLAHEPLTTGGKWPFERADWLIAAGLTVIGATLRIVGSDRALWMDEIS